MPTRLKIRNHLKTICCLALALWILSGCLCIAPEASAADVSYSNWRTDAKFYSGIMSLKTNTYNADRPLIILLPGVGEFSDVREAAKWIRNYHLYDDLDVDVATAAFWYEPFRISEWVKLSAEMLEFLQEKRDESSPFKVIIDAVSYSGYCGCFLAQLLTENGFQVEELNLADAIIPNQMSTDWLREIAAQGIRINIWASNRDGEMHEAGRAALEELQGTENIGGLVMDVWHGEILSSAIHDHGLHSEYAIPAE